ncbi:MAG: hypothetical protein ACKO85_04120, partial [Isosphaeraceae bacterium]
GKLAASSSRKSDPTPIKISRYRFGVSMPSPLKWLIMAVYRSAEFWRVQFTIFSTSFSLTTGIDAGLFLV